MTNRKSFLPRHAVALTLLAVLIAAVTAWKIGSPKWYGRLLFEDLSADGRYRVQTWHAYYFTSNDYGFARLYDNQTGNFMCESGVEWISDNVRIGWPDRFSSQISVGMDIHFALDPGGTACKVLQMRHDDPPAVKHPPSSPVPWTPTPGFATGSKNDR